MSVVGGTALGSVPKSVSPVVTDTSACVVMFGSALTTPAAPESVKTPIPPAPLGSKLVAQEIALVDSPEITCVRIRFGRSGPGPAAKAVSTDPTGPMSLRLQELPELMATLVTIVPMFPEPVVTIK